MLGLVCSPCTVSTSTAAVPADVPAAACAVLLPQLILTAAIDLFVLLPSSQKVERDYSCGSPAFW